MRQGLTRSAREVCSARQNKGQNEKSPRYSNREFEQQGLPYKNTSYDEKPIIIYHLTTAISAVGIRTNRA